MTATHRSFVRFFQILRVSGFKPPVRGTSLWPKIPAVLLCLAGAAVAEVFGDFTYTDNGADVTITGYAAGAPPNVAIPAMITISQDPLVVKTVARIGTSAFEGRPELISVTIPSGVTGIDTRAFYNCSGMTTVTMPSSLTTIGTYSFFGCVVLSNISVPSSVTSIGRNAFNYCSALTSMPLQPGLLTIDTEAFSRCGALTSVTIPPGVTTIGVGAFSYCSGLTSVVVPSSVTMIPSGVFNGCSGLTSVTLPSSITSIGTFAFYYCSGLTAITIPNVSNLQNKVFANCRGLTSVNIPATVTTVSVTAFAECSSLTSFTVDPANPNFSTVGGLLTNYAQTKLITCPGGVSGNFTIPTALTEIGIQAFQNCAALTGVTFHEGVVNIGNQAFSTCGKLINAVFLGDPPTFMASNAFELAAPGFAIYFHLNNTGFTSPEWNSYSAFDIGTTISEFNWLYFYGLSGNTDLLGDANGDGVKLLMAYALNLDPHRNLSGEMPRPVIAGNQMSLSFYAGRADITYRVKASDNLADWTTEVPLSEPDANQVRTATVNVSGPARYMRLEVSH